LQAADMAAFAKTRVWAAVACSMFLTSRAEDSMQNHTPNELPALRGSRVPSAGAENFGAAANVMLKSSFSTCRFQPSEVVNYCKANTMDKTLVAPADCSASSYRYGDLDSDKKSLEACQAAGHEGCHIVDRSGDMCFTCNMPDFAQKWFGDYCADTTFAAKNFFMKGDCSRVYWLHEGAASEEQCPGCFLFDHNGGKCPSGIKRSDMRSRMAGCVQYQPYWCWATSVSIMAGYYFPNSYPNGGHDGPNCRGMECRIVGEYHFPETPNKCCQDKDACFHLEAGSGARIVDALNRYTKIPWTRINVPVSESLVTRVMLDGNPIVWDVKLPPPMGGGHAMVMGGTDGEGTFYVHDPMNADGIGSFQSLRWSELLQYKLPWQKGGVAELWGVYVPSKYV